MAKTKIGRVAIIVKGTYDSTKAYTRLDGVSYNGNFYICIKDATNKVPTNTEYWLLSAEKGAKGTDATVNGYATTLIEEGTNITLEQEQGTITISATVPTKTSELTNDSNYAKTNTNNNFSTAQTITGTLTVNGDIVQNGSSYKVDTETIQTKSDYIILRDGAVGGLATNEYTGIEAKKYDGTNDGRLVFDNKGIARVGDVGDEQPLATRKESSKMTNGAVVVWNGTNEELETGNITTMVQAVPKKIATTLPSGALASKTNYYLGELTTLTLTPPNSTELGDYASIRFTSGTTPTVVTVGSTVVGDTDIEMVANKTYELYMEYNGAKWVLQYLAY